LGSERGLGVTRTFVCEADFDFGQTRGTPDPMLVGGTVDRILWLF
jgi:hypothetical protein